ncbi:ABC transporter permease [Candidatus Falkowbacteria bacterium]|nr:ABC transporter permease [Candidatus Falkowbacteria bacterium]
MKIHRINAILLRYLYGTKRNVHRLGDLFYWPILELVVFGFISVYFQKLSGELNVMAFFLGALIFWSILNRSSQDITVSFLEDIWSDNLLNIFASPLTVAEFILATIVLGLIRILAVLGVMTVLAFLIYHFSIFGFGVYLALFLINLIIFGWAIGIYAMAMVLRFGRQAQFLAWSLAALIQPASAVFYPASVLPRFLQVMGKGLPSTYVFEGMRTVISTGSLDVKNLVIAFGLNIIYLVLAVLFFRWVYGIVRKRGLLAKLS